MTDQAAIGRLPATAGEADLISRLAPFIAAGALFFNALLAAVNANVMALGSSHVMLAEIALAGTALTLALRSWRPHMFPWFALIYFLAVLFFVGIVINQDINLKYLRDAIIFPIYVLLGMVWAGQRFVPVLVGIQVVVFVVFVVEALSPAAYAQIFNVTEYYINTRGFDPERFQYTTEGFFISAFRPGERFIPGFDWLHRTSSVFLEPVSLGNYIVIVTILILAFWRELGTGVRALMVATTALLLIGSDSRLATVICLIIIAGSPVFVRLPKYLHVLYLPLAIAGAVFVIEAFQFRPGLDDFPGRIAGGIEALFNLDFAELMGHAQHADRYVDAGLAYLVVTQSVLGAVAIWLLMGLGFGETTPRERIFIHGVTMYFALSLTVSYSVFSIKTAALMWFAYGYLIASRYRATAGSGASVMSGRR